MLLETLDYDYEEEFDLTIPLDSMWLLQTVLYHIFESEYLTDLILNLIWTCFNPNLILWIFISMVVSVGRYFSF